MNFAIMVPILGILLAFIPVAGLTAVLTLRLGGKPFVETLARELKGVGDGRGGELELRIRDLTDQVEALSSEVHELRAAQSFDQKLLDSKEPEASAF